MIWNEEGDINVPKVISRMKDRCTRISQETN